MNSARQSLQNEVDRIRGALLSRHGYAPGTELPRQHSRSPLDDVQRLATVSAHWGIASDLPVFGRVLVLFRRVIRILLRWYINPIVDQQNAFNDAVVRALHELQTENDRLRQQLATVGSPSEQEQPAP